MDMRNLKEKQALQAAELSRLREAQLAANKARAAALLQQIKTSLDSSQVEDVKTSSKSRSITC